MVKLIWKPSFSASALHASNGAAHGFPFVDPRVPEAILDASMSIRELSRSISGNLSGNRSGGFWDELIGLSSEIESNRELAEQALKPYAQEIDSLASKIGSLAGWITEIEAAFRVLFPKLLQQLELRARPLMEIWEGYGNGLMAHLGRLTDRALYPSQAEVLLVQPVLGGFGKSHLGQNRVRIEAVLTNPIPELPEVVRLVWLLAQLNPPSLFADLSDAVEAGRLANLTGLAMLPPVLAAGQVVELTKIDEANLALAIEQWQIPVPVHGDPVAKLLTWWETYLQTRPEWSVAISALDRMFQSSDTF